MNKTDRRDFLKSAGLAAALASGVPIIGSAEGLKLGSGEQVSRKQYEILTGPVTGVNGYVYNPTMTTNSPRVDEQVVYAINMHVPRVDNYKWGFRGQLLELGSHKGCSGAGRANYRFTLQNEFRDLRDPIRFLTSHITLGYNPRIAVERHDTETAIVSSPLDDNYMEWVFKRQNGVEVPDLKINNLYRSHPQARTGFVFDQPADLGIRLENIVDKTPYAADNEVFHEHLRFVGDPHSIHSVILTRDGLDGHGVYETVGYRIEHDPRRNPAQDQTRGPIMAAEIQMVKGARSEFGVMIRNDERTLMFDSDYLLNEFWLAFFDPDANGGAGWYQGLNNGYKISSQRNLAGSKQTDFKRSDFEKLNRPYWLG